MEIIPIILILLICGALLLGYPVAFTLAGTSILFALIGIALDFFDQPRTADPRAYPRPP